MSIYERDYMRESTARVRSPSGVSTFIRIGIMLFALFLVFFSIRFRIPLYYKLPMLLGMALLIRWFFSFPRRMDGEFYLKEGFASERNRDYGDAVRYYELAAARLPKFPQLALRRLAAYHATQRDQKVRNLIAEIDGMLFEERDLEELEFLIAKHRPVSFERAGENYRVRLG